MVFRGKDICPLWLQATFKFSNMSSYIIPISLTITKHAMFLAMQLKLFMLTSRVQTVLCSNLCNIFLCISTHVSWRSKLIKNWWQTGDKDFSKAMSHAVHNLVQKAAVRRRKLCVIECVLKQLSHISLQMFGAFTGARWRMPRKDLRPSWTAKRLEKSCSYPMRLSPNYEAIKSSTICSLQLSSASGA